MVEPLELPWRLGLDAGTNGRTSSTFSSFFSSYFAFTISLYAGGLDTKDE